METIAIDFNMFWNPFEHNEGRGKCKSMSRSRKRGRRLVVIGICVAICGCGTARISGRHEIGAVAPTKPTVVYVSDFELEVANVKGERGLLPLPPTPPVPFGDILPPMLGAAKDPQQAAPRFGSGKTDLPAVIDISDLS